MTISNLTIRYSASRLLAAYVLSLFLICLLWFDLEFFTDSKNYRTFGYTYSNSQIHRVLLTWLPRYYYASSFIALFCVLYLVKKIHWALLIFLLHPYYLLLIFTATKEQLVFIGLFGVFTLFGRFSLKSGGLSLLSAFLSVPLLSMRSAYIPFFVSGLLGPLGRVKQVGLLYLVGILLIAGLGFKYSQQIASGIEVLQSRSSFAHIGRDYFPGLCVADKAESLSFIGCWFGTRLGIVIHEQFFSFNYFVHLGFLASFWFVVYLALKLERPFGLVMVVGMLAYHLLGTWWGPVLGAAERYFAPILWCVYLLAIGRILSSGCPKKAQWRFRAHLLKRKAKFQLAGRPSGTVNLL